MAPPTGCHYPRRLPPQNRRRLIYQRGQLIPWYDRHQLAGYPYADAVLMRGEGGHG